MRAPVANTRQSMKYALVLVLSLFHTQATADSWPPAKVAGLASPTGQIVARIVPGSKVDGARNSKTATATFYRLDSTANYRIVKEFSLLNPIAPVFAVIADSGELVTLDDWHNMGVGNAVAVVYSPSGKLLRSYRLADIYTEVEIEKLDRSVSSIWWRCPSQPVFEARTGVLEFMDAFGAKVGISIKTGVITRNATSQTRC